MTNIQKTLCPECDANINLSPDLEQGEIIICSDCRIELEVRSINPILLELAPEEEEDWGE